MPFTVNANRYRTGFVIRRNVRCNACGFARERHSNMNFRMRVSDRAFGGVQYWSTVGCPSSANSWYQTLHSEREASARWLRQEGNCGVSRPRGGATRRWQHPEWSGVAREWERASETEGNSFEGAVWQDVRCRGCGFRRMVHHSSLLNCPVAVIRTTGRWHAYTEMTVRHNYTNIILAHQYLARVARRGPVVADAIDSNSRVPLPGDQGDTIHIPTPEHPRGTTAILQGTARPAVRTAEVLVRQGLCGCGYCVRTGE